MSSVDRKLDRTICMLAYEAIKAQPQITRTELYEKLGTFSTKQIKKALKPHENTVWYCYKLVEHRGYKDYVTTYHYTLVEGAQYG